MISYRSSFRSSSAVVCLVVMAINAFTKRFLVEPAAAETNSFLSDADKARIDAKPWAMKNLEVKGYTFPMSPITLVLLWLACSYLYSALPKRGPRSGRPSVSTANASHIIMPDEEPLLDIKSQIGDNPQLLAEMAAKYSTCGSSQKGGRLDTFSPGTMAPPFERAVFDPDAIVVGRTLGPIQTHFGWHLIHVHERTLAE